MSLEVTQHQTADEAETEAPHGSSRRTVLRAAGVGGAVVAVGVVAAACGNSTSNNTSTSNQPTSGGSSSAPASSAAASSGSGGGTALAATTDVPVDGGKIVTADGGTVITQPVAGTYKAFTAICTHLQCTVGSVSNNQIMCPCHGSVYSAQDGHVISGPAPSPLAAKQISVSGGQIFLKA